MFYQADLLDAGALKKIFKENLIDCVIHFAGLKAVGESAAEHLKYFSNNLTGTINFLAVMQEYSCKKIIFSLSARLGVGSAVSNNLNITSDCKIGAGAVAVKDMTEAGTYAGVPASKLLKYKRN